MILKFLNLIVTCKELLNINYKNHLRVARKVKQQKCLKYFSFAPFHHRNTNGVGNLGGNGSGCEREEEGNDAGHDVTTPLRTKQVNTFVCTCVRARVRIL